MVLGVREECASNGVELKGDRYGDDDVVFFFNDTATTEIYTLSLHDALPIWRAVRRGSTVQTRIAAPLWRRRFGLRRTLARSRDRSEEHTSELQSH